MNWLTPGLAGLAAAIAIPTLLALYFLKLRRRDVEVSSTLLWKKSVQDLQANAPFQRLRRNILLFLQLLALLLGLLAIAQPTVASKGETSDRVVLVIDRSASMSAVERGDGETRLEKAKADALAYVASLDEATVLGGGESQEAMLIVFDASAEVILPFTSNKARLRSAIRSIEPTDAPSDISQAMRLARVHVETIREGIGLVPGAPIVVWSDGSVRGLDEVQLHPETDVRFRRVGEQNTGNFAITSMRVERAFDDPSEVTVFVALQNASDREQQVTVEFGVNGNVEAARARTLPPMGEDGRPVPSGVVFTLNTSRRALLTSNLVVEGLDALEADNTARVFLPSAERLRVGLVSTGNLFLESALEGMPIRLTTLSPDGFEQMRREARLNEYDAFVMDGWMPVIDDEEDGPSLPDGRYLIFGQIPTMRGLAPGEGAVNDQASIITSVTRDHPAMRLAGFEDIVIGRSLPMDVTGEARVLAESSDGPVIVEATDGAVRALVLAFDASDTSWPFDTGFVLFLANAIEYLGGEGGELDGSITLPGETLTTRLPAQAESVSVITPGGSRFEVNPSSDGRISFGPISKAGLYEVTWSGPPGPRDPVIDGRPRRPIPVNLFDPDESHLRVAETLDIATGRATASAVTGGETPEERAGLWKWALLGVLGMLMIEWYVYNRKVHV